MNNQFVRVCNEYELIENEGQRFELDDETEIALFRIKDKIYAVDNICPHNHSPVIFRGSIENNYISCPVHGFKFNLKTGKQPGRAGCTLRTFEVKTTDKVIYVKKPEKKLFDFNF